MKAPVTIAIPSLFDTAQFERGLPPLLEDLRQRDCGDQVLVIDDTGEGSLEPWMQQNFPAVELLSRQANGGFALALTDGIRAAKHNLVFCMNPDVVIRSGFLEPLVDCLQDSEVHSVVPQILLMGDADRVESISEVQFEHGLCSIQQPGLSGKAEKYRNESTQVPYAIGGAMLLRRDAFLESDGFDTLFAPFYWEDVDLGWTAWKAGQRVVYRPDSVVEHHHRGTIKSRVQADLVRAMIEKNRLLFQWKHLDNAAAIEEHLRALHRWAIDAWIGDEREELIWLALALQQADEVGERRSKMAPATLSFAELCERTKPSEG